MGIIGNHFLSNFGCHNQCYGGPTAAPLTPGNRLKYSQWKNVLSRDLSTTVLNTALPVGGYDHSVFFPLQTAGEMAFRTKGTGTLIADLYPSRSMFIDMTGSGDLDATGALVISMSCSMTGSGSFTATIQGRLNMSVDFNGSGDLDATIGALGNMIIAITGSGDLDATIHAYGNMEVDIVVTGTGLSTANVGQAVWNYLITSGLTAQQIQQILVSVAAGKTEIVDLGGGNATVTFRNISDTNNIVVADMSGSERTTVTLDPD